MKIPEFSVNRKVTTAMLAMILVVLGSLAFTRLGLDLFPDLEFPTVSVITIYSGASSEDIENTVTRPLEQVINSVNRVKKVNSITSEGYSVIMVEFEWGTNLDFAAQDIRDQIGLYESYLPDDVGDPLVVKFSFAMWPVLFGGITADRPTVELKDMIEDEVAPRLERIDGVASVQVYSTEVREILVNIDRGGLESRNLSLDQVLVALRMENLNLPAGHVIERHTDILVRTIGEFESIDDIRNTIVGATQTGQPIYMSDVAEVNDGLKETRYISRIQKEKGVIYMVSKRSGANTVITAEAVKKELARIQETLPPDVQFFPFMDQSDMIQQVIRRTGNNALVGGILAIFFIFIFLRNWRPTLTIGLAIPLSIITTFIALYAAGYTLNLLTMGGLALGVGMLVDNAVVVIENIFRHIEEGEEKNEAAKKGASEVGMAITASTLTTIAVFFPMIFAQGVTGKLTRGLALAIAFSLFASLFVALTIVPLVASLLFKHEGILWVGLIKQTERELSDQEIMERVRGRLPKLKNVKFEALDMSTMMTGGSQFPVEIKIFGKDLDLLKDIADDMVGRVNDVEGLRDVTHSMSEGKPEYHIRINREKASRLGLMVNQLANTVQTASLGKIATRYREGNEEVDIRVRFDRRYRDTLEDIKDIPIVTPNNSTIRLDQVATITRGEGQIQITRENQARQITVSANIAGRDLGSVVRDIKTRIVGIEKGLPSGYFIEFGGQYADMQDAFIIMAGAFLLATLLVYMIMASQFESFKHPLIIMFTIPLALIGVVVALLITGKPVSLPILIGFVMLGGIAVNNGIVMVDYINQLKRRGVEKKEAILQASSVRLRPVLITALTTVLGMLPMAIDVSQGSEMRAPMAITVIGGLIATTFLTLYVIPIIYSLFDRVSFKVRKV